MESSSCWPSKRRKRKENIIRDNRISSPALSTTTTDASNSSSKSTNIDSSKMNTKVHSTGSAPNLWASSTKRENTVPDIRSCVNTISSDERTEQKYTKEIDELRETNSKQAKEIKHLIQHNKKASSKKRENTVHDIRSCANTISSDERAEQKYAKEIDELRETNSKQAKEIKHLIQVNTELDACDRENKAQIQKLTDDIKRLECEKNDALLRLSEYMEARLTFNNPNIANLNDPNRPTKLAERFSELYDNEWTDAFERLTQKGKTKMKEKEACCLLLNTLMKIYARCKEIAIADARAVAEAVISFQGGDSLTVDEEKKLKEERKKNYKKHIDRVTHKLMKEEEVRTLLQKKRKKSTLKAYLNTVIELCWLMSIQEPPVYIDMNIDRQGQQFDRNLHRPYTQSGKQIHYIVWPTLYMYVGGPVLYKGIAQGINDFTNPVKNAGEVFSDGGDAKINANRERPIEVTQVQPQTNMVNVREGRTISMQLSSAVMDMILSDVDDKEESSICTIGSTH